MSLRSRAVRIMIWKYANLNPDRTSNGGKIIAYADKRTQSRSLSSKLMRVSCRTENGTCYERVSLKGSLPNGRAIYYIHGGAFFAALNPYYLHLAESFCNAMGGGEVVFVDYGVTPENKYPTQLDQADDVWTEITERLGYKAENVIIGGDSAGGNLTLALMLKLRDQGRSMPKGGFGISPWADMTAEGESYYFNYNNDVMFGNKKGKADDELRKKLITSELFSYAKELIYEERRSPYVSPVFGKYNGFPPMFFTVGEHEMLLSDTLTVAEKLRAENVEVNVDIGKKMFHIYALFPSQLPEAKRSFDKLTKFISKHLRVIR